MNTIGTILQKKELEQKESKHVTHEFQSFGLYLAEQLQDMKRRGVYMKYAKTYPRSILENALSFVIDSNAKDRGTLFMWKVNQLKGGTKK